MEAENENCDLALDSVQSRYVLKYPVEGRLTYLIYWCLAWKHLLINHFLNE